MAQFERGFALLIGVNENRVPGWSLPAVSNDIAAVAQVLADPDCCAYPPGHIKVISGGDTTRQGILDGLDWLHDQLQADTSGSATAIIFYSGHGWRDETAQPPAYYLIPYDVRQENLRMRALRVEDFAGAIQALPPCRLLVLLDCCHAAGMNAQDAPPAAVFPDAAFPPALLMDGTRAIGAGDGERGWESLPQGQGRAVLCSSQAGQLSFNRPDGKLDIFTGHLVEALSGNVQPQVGGHEVSVIDVLNHVWRSVPQSTQVGWGKIQQPDYQASANFPVALLRGGKEFSAGTPAQEASSPAVHSVSYAVNTGGGDFTGRDKIVHGDHIAGDKVAGDSIKVGNISGNGSAIAIGRNAHVTMTSGVSGADLDHAFTPIYQALRDAPPEKQAEAAQKVVSLKEEAAKGNKADDSHMAKLLDELVGLVPSMVTAVVSTFATPLLGGIAGPVTAFVVDKIRSAK